MTNADTVYLDTETTGFNAKYNDMLEIAITADDGTVLMNQLLHPTKVTSWPDAQKIHKISRAMVMDAPTLTQVEHQIAKLLTGKHVVIYNRTFDSAYLGKLLDGAVSVECCMLAWAEYKGVPNTRGGYNKTPWKWFKLTQAAEEVGHIWQGDAHRALADTEATRSVWQFLRNKGRV